MIYVNRSVQPIPKSLEESNPLLQEERAEAERFFSNPERSREQIRFQFSVAFRRDVKLALRKLFHDKCAYCEAKLDRVIARKKGGVSGDVEHYRPSTSVLESSSHSGYWWLASEWENLLIACEQCNRGNRSISGKGTRFPLKDERKRVFGPDQDLSLEKPLILNPCIDKPEEHLVFSDDGRVFSESERGKASILILGLNRRNLVEDRKEQVLRIKEKGSLLRSKMAKSKSKNLSLAAILENDSEINSLMDELQSLTESNAEFAGLNRQYVRSYFENSGVMSAQQSSGLEQQSYKVTKARQDTAKKAYTDYTKDLGNITLGGKVENKKSYLLLNHYIDKIELRNIKTFSHQIFDLTSSKESSAPWMMLLGENGAGKSTVLKSISMNMADEDYFKKLLLEGLVDPNRFIRHGCKSGSIKIWFSGVTNPRILELRKNEYTFLSPSGEKRILRLSHASEKVLEDTPWTAQTFLLAYGATRLLPRGHRSEEKTIESSYVRVDNLFNPFVPLADAEKWLLSLNATLFRRAAMIFKDLLNMGEDEDIKRKRGSIIFNLNGSKMPLDELSDGYQSVIALTADILQLAMKEWKNPDEARGIVMLDEVGAHLHPQWKMRIVGNLRKALPNMQFIVSSHQPLCLRGLGDGEVNILRRDEMKKVEVLTDLPNPKELRISQILTSVFGLSSTLDPELEAEYKRYYELRAKHSRSEEEDEELAYLEKQVTPDLMMGETLLDAQTYKVVKEQYNHYKEKDTQNDLGKLSKNTLSAVQSLWTK